MIGTVTCPECGDRFFSQAPMTGTFGDGWWVPEHYLAKPHWWSRRKRCTGVVVVTALPGQGKWRAYER